MLAAAGAALLFLRLLLSGQVALVHVLGASDASFWRKALFILLARAFAVPYVMHIHCGRFDAFHESQGAFGRRFIRNILEGARIVIAVAEEWVKPLAAIAPAARIVVVPNPVQIPAGPAGLQDGRPSVLYLGLLNEAKGVYDLLHAWPKVLKAIPEARLILAGSGELDRVDELAHTLGIRSSVETPGWLTSAAKEAAIRQASILARPSHAEALPMSVARVHGRRRSRGGDCGGRNSIGTRGWDMRPSGASRKSCRARVRIDATARRFGVARVDGARRTRACRAALFAGSFTSQDGSDMGPYSAPGQH